MKVFKTVWFAKFARKQRISDHALCDAVGRAERGLIDADLGGGLIKQRVAREGGGRSGGYRTLVAFRAGDRSVFVFGFAKNDRDNIAAEDERELKKLARLVLETSDEDMERSVAAGAFDEVNCNEQEKHKDISQ